MSKAFFRFLYYFPSRAKRLWHRVFVSPIIRHSFKSCGKQVIISTGCQFSGIENITVGNDVVLGHGTVIMSTRANVLFGDHIMFGPNVTIVTGDHRTDIIGKYMTRLSDRDKLPENDQDVVLEGDNWIGSHAIILKGVTVGRGAVVAAGAIVTKSVPPYSIVAGVPARTVKMRFTEEQIQEHKKRLEDRIK